MASVQSALPEHFVGVQSCCNRRVRGQQRSPLYLRLQRHGVSSMKFIHYDPISVNLFDYDFIVTYLSKKRRVKKHQSENIVRNCNRGGNTYDILTSMALCMSAYIQL